MGVQENQIKWGQVARSGLGSRYAALHPSLLLPFFPGLHLQIKMKPKTRTLSQANIAFIIILLALSWMSWLDSHNTSDKPN